MLLMDLISHISSEVLNSSAFGTNLNIYDEAFREKSLQFSYKRFMSDIWLCSEYVSGN